QIRLVESVETRGKPARPILPRRGDHQCLCDSRRVTSCLPVVSVMTTARLPFQENAISPRWILSTEVRRNLPTERSPSDPRVSGLNTPINVAIHTIPRRSEEHTSELQSRFDLVCRLLLE